MCAIFIYNVHLFQFDLFHFRMPPARRNPRYNVHNVIAIIQKGESDVDIDFDDTDAEEVMKNEILMSLWTKKTKNLPIVQLM